MNWLGRLFGSEGEQTGWTPEAKHFWQSIAENDRAKTISCVWCGRCKKPSGVPMVNYSGRLEEKDLILNGALCVQAAFGGGIALDESRFPSAVSMPRRLRWHRSNV